MKVVHCCLWCLEKCVRYITMNAYIMIAIEGKGFCLSAWSARPAKTPARVLAAPSEHAVSS